MLPKKLPLDMMQTKWASEIDPMLSNPMNSVSIIKAVLINGATVINHKLGKMQQGWFLVDVDGPATINRSKPFNDKTLTLTSTAAVNVLIGVF